MTMVARADNGIDILRQVVSLSSRSTQQANQKDFTFHSIKKLKVQNLPQRYEKVTILQNESNFY
jgi:hypothetical protein